MAMNPLPPQAYTKETLQKAFAWLQTQSASIKDMASTQDMLVSLYLKAQRNGEASLETPSIQNFKQELKSLAGLMGDLQTPGHNSLNLNAQSSAQGVGQNIGQYGGAMATAAANPNLPNHSASLFQNQQPNNPSLNQSGGALSAGATSLMAQLDPSSLQALTDVKNTLNLSSDVEALRALIALGYRHFKKIHA